MSYTFKTAGGKFHVDQGYNKLTPFGGLIAFASFLDGLGIIERLVETCPVNRTSNNALPVRDILVGFILTCVNEGRRFKDIRYLQNDPVITKAFGIKRRIPSDDTLRRFFEEIQSEDGKQWLYTVNDWLYQSLSDFYILDWDSTVTTRYGSQEGVEVGFNPHKPGRGSHHPLICTISGVRLCLHMDFRPGDAYTSSGWISTMEEFFSHLPSNKRPFLNRADIGFSSEEFLSWHEIVPSRPHYLFKLRKTKRVQEAIAHVTEDQWEGAASFGALQVAESNLMLHGWRKKRRVVLGRRLINKQSPEESGTLFGICEYHYYAFVTDLLESQFNTWQIVELYNQRADCENIYDELKNQWGLSGFCSQQSHVTEIAARLLLLSYNLWSVFVRFFSLNNHKEARTSRREFLLFPAQLVESGREKHLNVSVFGTLWEKIKEGYYRLIFWLKRTAPQLKIGSYFGNWAQAILPSINSPNVKLLTFNCGI